MPTHHGVQVEEEPVLTSRVVSAIVSVALAVGGVGGVGGDDARRGSITECSRYTGAGVTEWSDCLVVVRSSSLTLQLRASYFRSADASGIDGVSDWDIVSRSGTCRFEGVAVLTPRAGAGPARARLSCEAGAGAVSANSHRHLDLVVDSTGARTEADL